jgi:hypothetical protein
MMNLKFLNFFFTPTGLKYDELPILKKKNFENLKNAF